MFEIIFSISGFSDYIHYTVAIPFAVSITLQSSVICSILKYIYIYASLVAQMVRNPLATWDRHLSSIPGLGISPGGGYGNPLQYSGLENPMDRGVHGVTKSQT